MAARDLEITVGLDRIGQVRIHRDRVEAYDSAGRPLGVFPTEEAARLAVWQDWRQRIGEAADVAAG